MSAETKTVRKTSAPPAAPSVSRLVEERIAKPWRLGRRAGSVRKPWTTVQGWAVAAAIVAAVPVPASAQILWFDPDIATECVISDDGPGDDQAFDEARPSAAALPA